MSQAVGMEQLTHEARRHIELRAPQLVCFGPPIGPLGPLGSLRLELGPGGPVTLTLTAEVAASTFALLEHEAWFGNTLERRGPNLRGAFDPALPITITLVLARRALAERFQGDAAGLEGELQRLLRRLQTGSDDPESPDAWSFRDALQAVSNGGLQLGYSVSTSA